MLTLLCCSRLRPTAEGFLRHPVHHAGRSARLGILLADHIRLLWIPHRDGVFVSRDPECMGPERHVSISVCHTTDLSVYSYSEIQRYWQASLMSIPRFVSCNRPKILQNWCLLLRYHSSGLWRDLDEYAMRFCRLALLWEPQARIT